MLQVCCFPLAEVPCFQSCTAFARCTALAGAMHSAGFILASSVDGGIWRCNRACELSYLLTLGFHG